MTTTPPATGTEPRRLTVSVRTRITVAVSALVTTALTGAGLLVYLLGTARLDDNVRAHVAQEMAEFEQFQRNNQFASSRVLVREFLSQNVGSSSELFVGYWAGETRLRSFSARDALADDRVFETAADELATSGGAQRLDTRWGEVYVDSQPLSDGGAFLVAYFLDDEQATLDRTMRTYAIASMLALAVVTAVAAWQAGRLLGPVRTLREATEAIEEGGDLSRRIPEVGNDDITDLTRTVNAMFERLQQAFQGQRAFLDDAGHELRTPLTVVRGHLELLDEGDADDVVRTRALVLDEVDRMAGLVDDLITLAKADRPDFFSFAPTGVARLVDAVADKCRALGDRSWVVDERAEAVVQLDEQRITQALLQLAQNAVKHTTPRDTIGLGSSYADGAVRIWVRDTGPGVADEHKTSVFERFGRGEPRPGDDGFGLGLSIVTAIVQGHGGTIGVLDESPRGARFVIELPSRRTIA